MHVCTLLSYTFYLLCCDIHHRLAIKVRSNNMYTLDIMWEIRNYNKLLLVVPLHQSSFNVSSKASHLGFMCAF